MLYALLLFNTSIFHSEDHLYEYNSKLFVGKKYFSLYKVVNDKEAHRY